MMRRILGLVLIATCALTGHAWSQPAADRHGQHHERERTVRLTPEEMEEFGVEVDVARAGVIELFLSLPAEIQPNEDRLAHIVPRFSGIVTDVYVQLGDRVEEGQVLATVEGDESLAPYQVKTLISGTVISKHITLGEAVSRERDTFVIADLSTVWVDITLYQRDLDRVRTGQTAAVFVGHGQSKDTGTVSYVTPVVDEATRTATARIVLPNRDGRWRPGMFVTAEILIDRVEAAVAIPKTALQTLEGHAVVFVEVEGVFEAREVALGRSGGRLVEVLDGLAPGERYVRRGGFTLKAESGKDAFGDGHAH